MSVSRSALASNAARSACARRRRRSARRPSARSRGCGATRSPWRAELAVVDDLVEAGTRDASVFLRSWSKKNLASARRGRTTRSLPSTTRRGSAGRMLLTTRKRLVRLPARVEQREVLLVRLHRQDQALGRHREELGSNRQSSTFGRSTSAVTSSSSASSSIGARPSGGGRCIELTHDVVATILEARDHRAFARSCSA